MSKIVMIMSRLMPSHVKALEQIDNMIFLISPEGIGENSEESMLGLLRLELGNSALDT